jgi:hypothetical protein
MVKVIKTWETVFFHAESGKKKKNESAPLIATIELQINHATGAYNLNTPTQEMVRFRDDTPEMLDLKLEAVTAAVKYIRNIQDQQKK